MTNSTKTPVKAATKTPAKASGLEDVLPLSPLQEGLLFHALADEDGTDVYNTQLVMALEGPLDPARMRAAATALLHRHANLRAAFRQRANGQAIQVIHREVTLPWAEVDLSGLSGDARHTALDALLAEDRGRRFDLAVAPAARFTLVRAEAELHQLVLTNHHILLDGWSAPIVQRELLTLYAEGGAPTQLPPVTPYRTYLAWLAGRSAAGSAPRKPPGRPGPRRWPGCRPRRWSPRPTRSAPRCCPSTPPPASTRSGPRPSSRRHAPTG